MSTEAAGSPGQSARRARRLLMWYPVRWRARYGDEFVELLIADLAERPASVGRAADVVRAGLRARLAATGLASHPLDPTAAARARLATLASCLAVFGLFGVAMWSQLATAMQWAVPDDRGITQSLRLMSAALLIFVVLGLLGAAPVIWCVITSFARGDGRPLLRPSLMIMAATLVLVIGGRHFQNGWPGTGGHLLAHQGLVPAGIAAYGWAATMGITSYWAHPAALSAFPAAQLAWMAASPAVAACLVTSAARLLQRLDLSARALCYETWVGTIAGASMLAFLGAAAWWLGFAGAQDQPLFHAGVIDDAGLGVLALAALAGVQAVRRSLLWRKAASRGSAL